MGDSMSQIGEAEKSEGAKKIVHLAKTRLAIVGADLVRLNPDSSPMMVLSLETIEAADAKTYFSPFCLFFVAMGLAIAAIGYWVSETNWLSVILYLVAVLLVGGGGISCFPHGIHLKTATGWTTILCNDTGDDAKAFVLGLRSRIGQPQSSVASTP